MKLLKLLAYRFVASLSLFSVLALAPSAELAAAEVKIARPRIVVQPVANVNADFGTVVTLVAVATSGETPTYVWTKDGAVVTGATANSLPITVDEMADAGRYQVTISNRAGSVKSRVTQLRLNLAPASLPPGTALIGTLTLKGLGETSVSDGSYVIGVGDRIDDPEDDSDFLTYTYVRISANQARLTVKGSYFYPEIGRHPETQEFLFTFMSGTASGSRDTTVRMSGTITVTAGSKSKTFKFRGFGNMSFVPPGTAP